MTAKIIFNSVGHFFAKAYKVIAADEPKVVSGISDVEKTQIAADAITSVLDPAAVPLVDAGYAVLGELSSVLNSGGEAAKQKLLDAGLDINVITLVEGLIKKIEGISAVAKSIQK